jgi:NADPH:quinone reductase-like Zn-dependent oxidoreductase
MTLPAPLPIHLTDLHRHSSQTQDVLIQAHAMGLEGLDRQIVIGKLAVSNAGGKGATSFVPGRGVSGRVVASAD